MVSAPRVKGGRPRSPPPGGLQYGNTSREGLLSACTVPDSSPCESQRLTLTSSRGMCTGTLRLYFIEGADTAPPPPKTYLPYDPLGLISGFLVLSEISIELPHSEWLLDKGGLPFPRHVRTPLNTGLLASRRFSSRRESSEAYHFLCPTFAFCLGCLLILMPRHSPLPTTEEFSEPD